MRKAALLLLLVSFILPACKGDPPPPVKAEPRRPQPVPSDFVVNEFFTDDTKVSGVAGDASVNVGSLADGGATEPGGPPGDVRKVRLVEAGSEPRSARRYTFTAGKTETRVGSVRVAVTVEAAGQPPQQQPQPALELTMKLTPKAPTKGGFLFDVKLDKVGLAEGQGLDPRSAAEAQKQLAPLSGLGARFDVSSRGHVGEFAFAGDAKAAKAGGAEIIGLLQQTLEFVTVPFPEEPIGVGATWEDTNVSSDQGAKVKTITLFTLKEWSGDSGVVTADIKRSAPRTPLREPRMPPGTTLEIDGKGSYTFNVKLDRPSTKVTGESATAAKIQAPGQGGKPGQSILQSIKVRHALDTPASK